MVRTTIALKYSQTRCNVNNMILWDAYYGEYYAVYTIAIVS